MISLYVVPAPTVTAVSPSSGSTAGGASVGITGTNFTGATTVDFGSSSASFTYNSSTSITATSPAESAATVNVTVTTPGGTSAISSADDFTYGSDPTTAVLPSYNDAYANWSNEGLQPIGGIPTRTTICSTVSPSGKTPPTSGDDASLINSAISSCPAGEVVMLAAGTFNLDVSEQILINKGITLRAVSERIESWEGFPNRL